MFGHTKTVTWNIFRDRKLRTSEDIAKLPKKEYKMLENMVHKVVREEYEKLDKKYKGVWPGTSNRAPFSKKEF